MLSSLENPVHLLIVLTIVLLVFGAKRLPEVGRSLGRGMREFKDGVMGTECETLEHEALEREDRPGGQ